MKDNEVYRCQIVIVYKGKNSVVLALKFEPDPYAFRLPGWPEIEVE